METVSRQEPCQPALRSRPIAEGRSTAARPTDHTITDFTAGSRQPSPPREEAGWRDVPAKRTRTTPPATASNARTRGSQSPGAARIRPFAHRCCVPPSHVSHFFLLLPPPSPYLPPPGPPPPSESSSTPSGQRTLDASTSSAAPSPKWARGSWLQQKPGHRVDRAHPAPGGRHARSPRP